jgi:hypothetical protein
MRIKPFVLNGVLLGVMGVLIMFLCVWLPWSMSPRIVAEAKTPNGTHILLMQQRGGPYCTELFVKRGEGKWGSYYVDHDAWFCWRTEVSMDSNAATVTFGTLSKPIAVYDWKYDSMQIRRRGVLEYYADPNYFLPTNWIPAMGFYREDWRRYQQQQQQHSIP